jgi:hypothetical protein
MKPRDVTIKTVLNGWIVKVGCQDLVFTSLDVMLKDLTAYLEDPKGTEDRYQAEAVNAEFFNFEEVVAGYTRAEPERPLRLHDENSL